MPTLPTIKRFIEDNFKIVDKEKSQVKFVLNRVQDRFLLEDYADKCVILKARQQGFSSLITALFTFDFIMTPNTYNVVVADKAENAEGLLARVKSYLEQLETRIGKLPLKYNSKYHLYLPHINSTFIIGTAENRDLARSKTVTNLHLSEAALYPSLKDIMAGAVQAVIPGGRVIMETTANGYNEFKDFWDKSVAGETGYKPLFYKASDFYSPDFLDRKRLELDFDRFNQEYPENPTLAFVSSGSKYFNAESLNRYLEDVKNAETVSQFNR